MGHARSCDARCHKSKRPRCACWCGGLFHGGAGETARQAFRDTFGELCATERDFEAQTRQGNLFGRVTWQKAIDAARQARGAGAA